MAFALFVTIVLSVSFVAADGLGTKRVSLGTKDVSEHLIKSDAFSTVESQETAALFGIPVLYDFVCGDDIRAYQCRMGAYPAELPDYFDSEVCNRQFLDITDDDRLDWPEGDAAGSPGWKNYATHHFFVLENVNGASLRALVVGYVSVNKYSGPGEHHKFYAKNFDTNEWVLLDDRFVDLHDQALMGVVTGWGDKSAYVNCENEMWFLGTEGPHTYDTIGTDAFGALLIFSIFGVDEIDQVVHPEWMNYLFEDDSYLFEDQ